MLAIMLTLASVGFAAGVTFVVVRDRRRRRGRQSQALTVIPGVDEHGDDGEMAISEAAECAQVWLDSQWQRKFG